MHLVRTRHATVLLDCGLFQGRRRESIERNRHLPHPRRARSTPSCSRTRTSITPARCRCSARTATRGPSTRRRRRAISARSCSRRGDDPGTPTRAISTSRASAKGARTSSSSRSTPTTTSSRALSGSITVPYHRADHHRAGVRLTFLDAGHVLGSAITVLDVEEDGKKQAHRLHRRSRPRRARPSCAIPRSPRARTCSSPRAPTAIASTTAVDKMEDDLARVVNAHRSSAAARCHPVVRARARAGGHLRAQEAAQDGQDPARCRSTSTRRSR